MHVRDRLEQGRPLPDQVMATRAFRTVHGPRHGEDLASHVGGLHRREHGPAPSGRLDDDHRVRDPRHQPVPFRERVAKGRRVVLRLAQDASLDLDLSPQPDVLRRIGPVDPVGHDPDGPPPGLEGAAMGGGVDATRQAAGDHPAATDQIR